MQEHANRNQDDQRDPVGGREQAAEAVVTSMDCSAWSPPENVGEMTMVPSALGARLRKATQVVA